MRRAAGCVLVAAVTTVLFFAESCKSSPRGLSGSEWVLTRGGLGPIRLCAPLDSVASAFDSVTDTLFEYGDESWPGRVVSFPAGKAVFAASWTDWHRIWTISTTSSDVRTANGYRVGEAVGTIIESREPVTILEPEGQLVLYLDEQGISINVDSTSESHFFARSSPSIPPNLTDVPREARIRELFVSGNCTDTRLR